MRFRLLYSICFACAFGAGATRSFAQSPSQSTPSVASVPRTITLDDAIKQAIARNYTVRSSGNSARRDEIEVTRTKDNMWLPTAGATGSWGYNYSLQPLATRTRSLQGDTLIGGVLTAVPIGEVITPAGSHSLSWDASARYNLYHGGSDIAHVHAAEATLGFAQYSFTWTRQETAFYVTGDYLTVLRTDELVTAADSTLAEALAQYRLVNGKYQAGVIPIGQVYQQLAVVEGDSLALIVARNNYENAQTDLLFELNVPPNEYSNYSFSLAGIDTSTTAAARAAVDTTITPERINATIDKRPDILAQEQAIQATLYGIDVTRGGLLPSLDASVGIGGSGSDPDLLRIQMSNGLKAGLTLTVPIFDAMQNRLSIQEQEVNAENDRITLEQDVQQIRSDAAKAVNNLKASDLALTSTDAALTAAEESQRLATERLRVGAGTEVDVIIAEAATETARTNRVNAKYNWILAQRQLAYTLGQWNY